MSSNSLNVTNLVNAVGEDSNLSPNQKETTMGWTKDGRPTTAATQFNHHVASVYTEEAGISRRLLKHSHFTPTEIRVGELGKGVTYIEPNNFCGGKVTAVGGYLPIGTVTWGTSIRSKPGHANVVPFTGSASNSSQSSSPNTSSATSSGGVTEEQAAMDNTDDDSDYKVTDPLDW